MKAYTDIKQSKKLAEILPLKTADMCYRIVAYNPNDSHEYQPYCFVGTLDSDIPCWSLAALLNYLKSKNKFPEIKELSDGRFKLTTFIWDGKNSIQFSIADNLVDACVEMILKLKGNNML